MPGSESQGINQLFLVLELPKEAAANEDRIHLQVMWRQRAGDSKSSEEFRC